ncbi:DUF397 domain-containing protein [Kribbella sp. NBC_01245]|uniref:DUF397 domain-containing protein n=1 Tax=Kribbella sp. NBC_01245 TaxID=2903578 RepID=UPI002E285692|nr:DUF397 domain-containing protein [Kribbella sp. NBC_01245]
MASLSTKAWRPPAGWEKSRFSNANNNCLYVLELPGGGASLLDSKLEDDSPELTFTAGEWNAFLEAVLAGQWRPVATRSGPLRRRLSWALMFALSRRRLGAARTPRSLLGSS